MILQAQIAEALGYNMILAYEKDEMPLQTLL